MPRSVIFLIFIVCVSQQSCRATVSYDALLRGDDKDARIGNIVVKLSGQTTEDLAHLEQVIQAVIDYGSRD